VRGDRFAIVTAWANDLQREVGLRLRVVRSSDIIGHILDTGLSGPERHVDRHRTAFTLLVYVLCLAQRTWDVEPMSNAAVTSFAGHCDGAFRDGVPADVDAELRNVRGALLLWADACCRAGTYEELKRRIGLLNDPVVSVNNQPGRCVYGNDRLRGPGSGQRQRCPVRTDHIRLLLCRDHERMLVESDPGPFELPPSTVTPRDVVTRAGAHGGR
jgi:hypothetical protein